MRPESGRQPLRVSPPLHPGPTRRSGAAVPSRPRGGQNPLTRVADVGTWPRDCSTSCAASHWSASSQGSKVGRSHSLTRETWKTWRSQLGVEDRLGGGKKTPQPKRARVTPNHSLGRPFISTAFSLRLFQSEGWKKKPTTHTHTKRRHESNRGLVWRWSSKRRAKRAGLKAEEKHSKPAHLATTLAQEQHISGAMVRSVACKCGAETRIRRWVSFECCCLFSAKKMKHSEKEKSIRKKGKKEEEKASHQLAATPVTCVPVRSWIKSQKRFSSKKHKKKTLQKKWQNKK